MTFLTWLIDRLVPEGWEDAAGFHYGPKPIQTSAEPCAADQEARAPAGHARPASDLTPGVFLLAPGDTDAAVSNGGRVFLGEGACPPVSLVDALLSYDPETGKLEWRTRPNSIFATQRACNIWNARFAGAEAFTTIGTSGYREGRIFRKLYRAHRVAFALTSGEWPVDEVDHINGDRLDNRAINLRAATRAENGRNQRRPCDNQSGFIGVSWFARDSKWQARISTGGKSIHLGYFAEKIDAIEARKDAEFQLGFHENHGRP